MNTPDKEPPIDRGQYRFALSMTAILAAGTATILDRCDANHTHRRRLSQERQIHSSYIDSLNAEHREEINRLRTQHNSEIARLRARLEELTPEVSANTPIAQELPSPGMYAQPGAAGAAKAVTESDLVLKTPKRSVQPQRINAWRTTTIDDRYQGGTTEKQKQGSQPQVDINIPMPEADTNDVEVGSIVKQLRIPDTDEGGAELPIDDLKAFLGDLQQESFSKLVVLDLSADWCGSCMKIKPLLKKVAEEMDSKNNPILFSNIHLEDGAYYTREQRQAIKDFCIDGGLERELIDTFEHKNLPFFIYMYKGKVIKFQDGPAQFVGPSGKITKQQISRFFQKCVQGTCGRYYEKAVTEARMPKQNRDPKTGRWLLGNPGTLDEVKRTIRKYRNKKAKWNPPYRPRN